VLQGSRPKISFKPLIPFLVLRNLNCSGTSLSIGLAQEKTPRTSLKRLFMQVLVKSQRRSLMHLVAVKIRLYLLVTSAAHNGNGLVELNRLLTQDEGRPLNMMLFQFSAYPRDRVPPWQSPPFLCHQISRTKRRKDRPSITSIVTQNHQSSSSAASPPRRKPSTN
jgi:hypothetical protein